MIQRSMKEYKESITTFIRNQARLKYTKEVKFIFLNQFQKGNTYFEWKLYKEAYHSYKQANQIFPKNPEVLFKMAKSLRLFVKDTINLKHYIEKEGLKWILEEEYEELKEIDMEPIKFQMNQYESDKNYLSNQRLFMTFRTRLIQYALWLLKKI